ncbi:hypothetical protein IC762_12120 [Bradyrhizobium genosp. L]|uniref:hypothetical protein n=1 Tax=Bradyrhizobium genosp. L TaxID=83637 RepID=UPI0018A28D95|nr:hypothetical protein [Bradyrhizobium genosp. L]QPF86990.1 hypothetical protein IC762_12120 [Bradyrhizobium genosp. L]
MTNMLHKKWSTYAALASWGTAAFMAQPTLASFAAHFVINPLILGAVIWLAHHEGKAT